MAIEAALCALWSCSHDVPFSGRGPDCLAAYQARKTEIRNTASFLAQFRDTGFALELWGRERILKFRYVDNRHGLYGAGSDIRLDEPLRHRLQSFLRAADSRGFYKEPGKDYIEMDLPVAPTARLRLLLPPGRIAPGIGLGKYYPGHLRTDFNRHSFIAVDSDAVFVQLNAADAVLH
ncbi:hypothetical protein GCM10023184_46450 [Flaviaesturariibacter amylovorans]|uniref:FAD-binding domain-containing protein n=2 Tax=Flaviaesturariibacter amylovorans TaxID=1084520 RepID=A0ABP8HUL2_9BACT